MYRTITYTIKTEFILKEIFLLKKTAGDVPKLIKFEKRGRKALDEYLNRGQYSKNSLLFQIIKEEKFYLKKLPRLFNYASYILNNIINKYLKHR